MLLAKSEAILGSAFQEETKGIIGDEDLRVSSHRRENVHSRQFELIWKKWEVFQEKVGLLFQ
jgi:hypothetical protein